MLDKYIEELVKSASVKGKLDEHLSELTKQATAKVELEQALENATVGELAKLAGITLPENVCTGCGSEMQKLGSVLQCSCGMLKKATKKKTALMPLPGASSALSRGISQSANRLTGRMAAGRAARAAVAPATAAQRAAPLLTGAGGGALTAKELASAQGPMQRAAGAVKSGLGSLKQKLMPAGGATAMTPKMASAKKVAMEKCSDCEGGCESGCECSCHEKSASIAKFAQVMRVAGGDIDKALNQLEKEGYTKLAFNPVQAVKNMGQLAGHGAKQLGAKAMANPTIAKGVGAVGNAVADGGAKGLATRTALTTGVGAAGGAISAGEGNRGKGALMGAAIGGTAGGVAGAGRMMKTLGGGSMRAGMAQAGRVAQAGGGAKGLAQAVGRPGMISAQRLATPVAAAGGLASGAMMGGEKTSAVKLLEVGDAAGRILAKTAMSVTPSPDEVAESITEAKEREDVPGRAGRWGIGGAIAGGAGGAALGAGAGMGLNRLLSNSLSRGSPSFGKYRALAGGVGGLLGGLGGGLAGHQVGEHHGAEEAEADRLVSFLRGRRAYMTGQQEGMQQGYLTGLTNGMGEDGSDAGPQ